MKEILTDLLQPFKSNIVQRLTSPLIVGYCISWVAINFKFIIIVFSNNKATVVFDLIDRHIFPTPLLTAHFFFTPLLAALSYIFIIERFARWVQLEKLSYDIAFENAKIKKEGTRVIDEKRGAALVAEMISLRSNHKVEIEEKNEKINQLEKSIEQLRPKLNVLEGSEKQKIHLTTLEFQIMSLIEKHGSLTIEQIMSLTSLGVNKIDEIKSTMETLTRAELILKEMHEVEVAFDLTNYGLRTLHANSSP